MVFSYGVANSAASIKKITFQSNNNPRERMSTFETEKKHVDFDWFSYGFLLNAPGSTEKNIGYFGPPMIRSE